MHIKQISLTIQILQNENSTILMIFFTLSFFQ